MFYNNASNAFPGNAGYVSLALGSGTAPLRVPVNYPGETPDQSNVWHPRANATGTYVALEKFGLSPVENQLLPRGEIAQMMWNLMFMRGPVTAWGD